jgi:hypothetical protein
MTTIELIWGWTQFVLNVVLIFSGLKVVWDISRYSTIRCKILHMKICKEGMKLQQMYNTSGCFTSRFQVQKFRKLVIKLLILDPTTSNPFDPKGAKDVFWEFNDAKKIYKATYHGPRSRT